MKKIATMITYICDGCGMHFRDENGCIGYLDYDIWNEAEDSDWHEIDGKHFCPDCCEINEDTDEWQPKVKSNEK